MYLFCKWTHHRFLAVYLFCSPARISLSTTAFSWWAARLPSMVRRQCLLCLYPFCVATFIYLFSLSLSISNPSYPGQPLKKPCPTLNDVLDHLAQVCDGTSVLLDHVPGNMYGVTKREKAVVHSDNFYGAKADEELPMYGAKQPPWLFTMTRREAESELAKNPARGHFLVRESESRPGHYAISLVSASV